MKVHVGKERWGANPGSKRFVDPPGMNVDDVLMRLACTQRAHSSVLIRSLAHRILDACVVLLCKGHKDWLMANTMQTQVVRWCVHESFYSRNHCFRGGGAEHM